MDQVVISKSYGSHGPGYYASYRQTCANLELNLIVTCAMLLRLWSKGMFRYYIDMAEQIQSDMRLVYLTTQVKPFLTLDMPLGLDVNHRM